eukprot:12420890-Karenia_brevis.AAC.1
MMMMIVIDIKITITILVGRGAPPFHQQTGVMITERQKRLHPSAVILIQALSKPLQAPSTHSYTASIRSTDTVGFPV